VLDSLLKAIGEGGAHSQSELARSLGVSEDLLAQMVEDLVRMGYLEAVGGACTSACSGCPMGDLCAIGGQGTVWTLTEKGQRAALKVA
jgi:Mn-dependent DtxR family transcriptional regulator